jgi:hypothetical protein
LRWNTFRGRGGKGRGGEGRGGEGRGEERRGKEGEFEVCHLLRRGSGNNKKKQERKYMESR